MLKLILSFSFAFMLLSCHASKDAPNKQFQICAKESINNDVKMNNIDNSQIKNIEKTILEIWRTEQKQNSETLASWSDSLKNLFLECPFDNLIEISLESGWSDDGIEYYVFFTTPNRPDMLLLIITYLDGNYSYEFTRFLE